MILIPFKMSHETGVAKLANYYRYFEVSHADFSPLLHNHVHNDANYVQNVAYGSVALLSHNTLK